MIQHTGTRAVALALSLIALASCASHSPSAPAQALVGTWVPQQAQPADLPAACRSASIVVDADTITHRSGSLSVVARYSAVRNGSLYTVTQTPLKHSGSENCQGFAASYVLEHFAPTLEMEASGDRMRMYFWKK